MLLFRNKYKGYYERFVKQLCLLNIFKMKFIASNTSLHLPKSILKTYLPYFVRDCSTLIITSPHNSSSMENCITFT